MRILKFSECYRITGKSISLTFAFRPILRTKALPAPMNWETSNWSCALPSQAFSRQWKCPSINEKKVQRYFFRRLFFSHDGKSDELIVRQIGCYAQMNVVSNYLM